MMDACIQRIVEIRWAVEVMTGDLPESQKDIWSSLMRGARTIDVGTPTGIAGRSLGIDESLGQGLQARVIK
jgi:hypothetical protein